MSDKRGIYATFSNWRPVQGRKVLQLVMEVPIEKTKEVLTMLGDPSDQWVAIALLKEKPVASAGSTKTPADASTSPEPPQVQIREAVPTVAPEQKQRRKFSELSLPEQAGIRCADTDFLTFLRDKHQSWWFSQDECGPHERASRTVRALCVVDSRAKLETNDAAGKRWRDLEAQYQAWRTDQAYGAVVR